MRTTIKVTTVLALVLTLGWHWALLQTVAWTGMMITYSQENSFRDAMRMTFDGRHPCSLCQAIQQGRAAEQDQDQLAPSSKQPPGVIWEPPFLCFDAERERISVSDESGPARRESPPKPPPRRLPPALVTGCPARFA